MEQQQNLLEKMIWSNDDFENMGWKDTFIHAIATVPEKYEIWLDIDYIVRWVNPNSTENTFSFWVAPATLVFSNVCDLEIHLESQSGGFLIRSFERSDEQLTPNKEMNVWLWEFDLDEGNLSFRTTGFTQFFRRKPSLTHSQQLSISERGGISFNRESSSSKHNDLNPE